MEFRRSFAYGNTFKILLGTKQRENRMRIAKVLFVLLFLAVGSNAFAGFGIHVGKDMTTVDKIEQNFNFNGDPAGTPSTLLVRDESSQPFNAGIDLTFGMLPLIDLQLSIEGAWAKYDAYIYPAFGSPVAQPPVEEKDIPYARLGADVSALVNIPVLGFPPVAPVVKVYAGAALSFQAFGPVISEQLLVDNIDSYTDTIDPVELAEEIETKMGLHGIVGLKIAPPASPISLKVQAKYYSFFDAAEDTPDGFMVFQAGIYFF